MARAWLFVLGLGLGFAGCSEESRLAVEGPTPYARCLARQGGAPGARIGAHALSVEDGVLSIASLPKALRVLAFAGPGPGPGPAPGPGSDATWARAVAAARAGLVLLLGDLGDDLEAARATASALDRLGVPVLVIGGGRDTLETLAAADALPNVVDVSGMRAVRLIQAPKGGPADYRLVPVAGALDGRYARSASACGYAADDLDARELPKPEPGERRLLLAWQAPTGLDPAVADAGSAALAAFAHAVGASSGLFAWPPAQAGRPRSLRDGSSRPLGAPVEDLALVVPRLAGPAVERADGSRLPPGYALLELAARGPVLRELTPLPLP